MDREALVYVDLDGKPHLVGRLWAHVRKNKESASFEYDKTWLENPVRFSLEPALQVGPGAFHAPAETLLFGAVGDSAPDRWGRALRFAEKEGGPFLREEGIKPIPPLVELPELLSAAEHVVEDKDTEEDLRLHRAGGLAWRRAAKGFRYRKGWPARDREISAAR